MKLEKISSIYVNSDVQKNNLIKKSSVNNKYSVIDENTLSPAEITGRSLVNFQGSGKSLNKQDKSFIDMISKELKLKQSDVQQTVVKFLEDNNYKSLSDIGGEEFIDEQCKLQEMITKNKNLDEIDNEYLAGEIVNRCDLGEKYVPSPKMAEFEKYTEMMGTLKKSFEVDSAFTKVISKSLGLSKANDNKLKDILREFLIEHKIKTLKEMSSFECINDIAGLTEKIGKELDLSDFESNLLTGEINNWILSPKGKYKPIITHLDKDFEVFDTVCDKFNIDSNYRYELFSTMRDEALKNKYSSIFEIFDKKNNYLGSETCKKIKTINNPEIIQSLTLELGLLKDDKKRLAIKISKHARMENFYSTAKDNIILNKLRDEFGFSKDSLINIKAQLKKRYPSYVEGGTKTDIKQIAFEIADKYNLVGKAETKIIDIINKADKMSINELDRFIIEILKK